MHVRLNHIDEERTVFLTNCKIIKDDGKILELEVSETYCDGEQIDIKSILDFHHFDGYILDEYLNNLRLNYHIKKENGLHQFIFERLQ